LKLSSLFVVITATAALLMGVSTAKAATTKRSAYCPYQLSAMVDALTEIDGRLNGVGLSRLELGELINEARVAYTRVPRYYSTPCLNNVEIPARRAFNNYVRSYNAWGNCIYAMQSSCPGPTVQRYWATATTNVTRAVDYLG
jgi:hypothetical protein